MDDDKVKTMSPKDANAGAQVTLSELNRQNSVAYATDACEGQPLPHDATDGGLGKKELSTLGAVALGYTSLATWIAYSVSAATALASGGANVLVWGMIIVGICNMAAAVTISEPASQFPNASGQAAWVYRLHGRFASYVTSWSVLLGYIFLNVAGHLIVSTIVLAMINLTFPSYVIQPWHVCLGIIVASLFSFVVASVAAKLVSRLNVFSFTWSVTGLLVTVLVLLIQSRGEYNTVEFALVDIVNLSGWGNDFVPWVLGLSQAALSTTAMDAASHFSEEMPNPSKQVPIAIIGGLGTSIVVTLAYAFVLAFTLPSLDAIISTTTGFPFAEILRIKTSRAGAIVLLLIPLIAFLVTMADVTMAASRCVYGFSRQKGFPCSGFFGVINSKFDSPLRAGLLVWVSTSCICLIYIGNTAAFNALISVPTLLLGGSYSIVAYVCLVARWRAGRETPRAVTMDKVSAEGTSAEMSECDAEWNPPFKMPAWLTVSCNVLTIVFTVLLCVFLSLPPSYPVTSANMNYTSVFLVGGGFVIPAICWIRYRGVYQGPLVH